MSHEMIGTATINGTKTSIREYDNGFFVVEVDKEVKYSGKTLKELTDKLKNDGVKYTIMKIDVLAENNLLGEFSDYLNEMEVDFEKRTLQAFDDTGLTRELITITVMSIPYLAQIIIAFINKKSDAIEFSIEYYDRTTGNPIKVSLKAKNPEEISKLLEIAERVRITKNS